jgi:branched-chain amino acid transport system substrate-binding protein
MKNMFKKVMSLTLAATMAVGSMLTLASCGEKNYAKDNETIKIGVSGPLTGGAAKYGVAVKNSAQMAIDEINAAGGLDGMKFELLALDDEHKKENVTTTYSAMYEAGMQISLGTVTTAPGLEFKELSKEDNVFALTPSATGDGITEYENTYQMCFSDSSQGTAAAKVFNEEYKGLKVGVFYKTDDEYSMGIYENFMATLDESFKAGLVSAPFNGDSLDFSSQVELLKDCDVVFIPVYTGPAAALMKRGTDTLKPDAVYYGCDGLDGVEAEFGSMDEFMKIPQEVSFLSHFNTNAPEGTPAAEFVAKYNARFDEEKEPVNQFGAAAYDCVYAIYAALKVAKANGKEFDTTTSASDFCEILKEVFNSDSFVFHGITGKCEGNNKSDITWSSDGLVNKAADKYVVKEKNS